MSEDGAFATQCEPRGFCGEPKGGRLSVVEVSSQVSSVVSMPETGAPTGVLRTERDNESVASDGDANSGLAAKEDLPTPKNVGFVDMIESARELSNVSQADNETASGASPGRNVGFAADCDKHESKKTFENDDSRTSRGALVSRKSHFSRFMKTDNGQNGDVISPRKAARKTLTDLMTRRKTTGIGCQDSSPRDVRTRKTLGNARLELYNDVALDEEDNAAKSPMPGIRSTRAPSRTDLRAKNLNRSRSMSRGPRRGRDRFRGMGAMFSTSKARNPPRPPRETGSNENIPAGTKSSKVLSIIRGRRPISPSPGREEKADLLKCRSEDVLPSSQ